ncbi:MAG: hypothetical protein A3C43_03370 [Candidatus Schekmanbacteria bacterium RIFCSPHIGHO2_02_FULL_38_11]|uniref:HTH cro/C1-type domain-containing protein n=1 Tax=Candidatus Schekmanbacteria bacterium RIFCSPLOWO2_12_FULL_38_15 TaxID=1817883 RepID=A0A1F7SNX1_9BACT|nr:MAG: hypothetical protein A2043_05445 [Candidatus Schekmanbacteria bacterium GWA2_38_9]OGL50213.1 MAG: hypothetical protein A3H37_00460 [Candidatus Schekmanbacteria bacterium RIFCSPLOWO2_02_FULL_38_14]OGL55193.1 MAG: hypothetical protein A3C43_03370 [Candidatus Schekmanbacteria bacterium RIFCSPHIGHO2_02_FULL_38_11]OGL55476.1 MAG: hypothetical protein A3G31_01540 [Candidatus Schekmanbacteria bacterium RIFCSPLOWO2_12_FULL_38_15]
MALDNKNTKEEVRGLKIGEKIKGLRKSREVSLKGLSEKTGFSETVLSQIEDDTVAPPIPALLKISRALGVEIVYFFSEERSDRKFDIVRVNERKKVERKLPQRKAMPLSYSYEMLSSHRKENHMQPFLVEFDINIEEEVAPVSHEGEEFLFLLEGELEYKLENEIITLKKGDSLCFDSKIPHAFNGIGNIKPKAVVVLYTPKE